MNIALLHFAGPPVVGGVEKVILEHARMMADDGHNVTIIAGKGSRVDSRIGFTQIPLAHSRHAEILSSKKLLDQGTIPDNFDSLTNRIYDELIEALKGIEILFVHNVLTMTKNLPLVAALKRYLQKQNLPVVAWHHDIAAGSKRYGNEIHKGFPWNLVTQTWSDVPLKHIAVSEARKQSLSDLLNIPADKIEVIPSGISPTLFFKLEERTVQLFDLLGLAEVTPLLLLPMRITRRKNIELALRITAALRTYFPSATLVITGPPGAHNPTNTGYANELICLRDKLDNNTNGSGSIAHFLFEVSDDYLPNEIISDFYRLADALLITSADEGLGIPIMEAGFGRIPVFCSNIPPFHEIAGNFALFFELDDKPEATAKRIAQQLKQDTLHSLRDRVRSKFSWGALYQQKIAPLLSELLL